MSQYYREVCDIVGGSRASLMRNDPNGAAMPLKTEPSGTPPALTVPLSHYWYFSRAYQKELSQFEKKFGFKINAEVSVSLSAVDENSSHKLPEVTQKFTDLYLKSTCHLDSVHIPPTQLESEIVKPVVCGIQSDQVKMTLDMSAGECLLFGPNNYISSIRNQMDLEYGMESARSFNKDMANEMETETRDASRNWSSPAIRSFEMDIKGPQGPIMMTESKKLIGYPGQFQQLSRNRSRLQGVDTSKGAFWTHSNSGEATINPRQATAGGAQGKGSDKSEDEKCIICLDKCTNKEKLICGHEFCRKCLESAMKSMGEKCPLCMKIFGKLIGNQPEGKMTHRQSTFSLPGYPHCGTIEIEYDIPGGIQTDKHPNPGARYCSTHRLAFLPDSDEGRHVLKLLRRAFDQKLIFTVGTSMTTGIENSVIWNEIYHKTNPHGGPQSYGYPDPDYLRRVKEELKSKGIE